MRSHLAFSLALAAICTVNLPLAFAKSDEPAETFPQIVRISHVEGDVRVSRGREGGAPKDVDWEKAVEGLPLQAGFSLATGDGRAEIEFEDASTIYLAPNSVLIFNELDSTDQVPHTEFAMLSGTVTLNLRPNIKRESYVVRTPTDTMVTSYGQKSDLRVTAYMDAIGITPLETGIIRTSKDTTQVVRPGHTDYFRSGKPIDFTGPRDENDYIAWDKWVADRVTQRDAAIAQMLKETGLTEPIPGLAQMAGQGKFVDCPGYGKCWQPPARNASLQKIANEQSKPAPALLPSKSEYSLVGEPAAPAPSAGPSPSMGGYDMADAFFPCGPESIYYRMAMFNGGGMYPMGGYMNGLGYGGLGYMGVGYGGGFGYMNDPFSWDWAVCHSGGWIYQGNQYLWVPGQMRRYQPPVRWVRVGHNVGFVPLNPRDVNGKPPINQRHGIFAVDEKKGFHVQRINATPGSEVKPLNEAPREFRKSGSPTLTRTDAPRMEAHMLQGERLNAGKEGPGRSGALTANEVRSNIAKGPGSRNGESRSPGLRNGNPSEIPGTTIAGKGPRGSGAGIPLVFDHRSQSFLMSHVVGQGDSVRTVNEPVGSYLGRSGATFGGRQGQPGEPGYRAAGPAGGGNNGATGFRGGGMINGGGNGGSRGAEGGGGFQGGGPRSGGYGGGNSGGFQGASGAGGGGGGGPRGGGGGGGGGFQGGGGGGFQGGGGGGGPRGGGGGGFSPSAGGGGGGAPAGGGGAPSGGGHK